MTDKHLSPVPEQYFRMEMSNLDHISNYYVDLSESDASWMALNHMVGLVRNARIAANNAVSWRDMQVGAAGIAYDTDRMLSATMVGFNLKPDQDGDMNIHAEQMVIERLRRLGFATIQGIAVWGEPQADDATGLISSTLHPCGLCREFMEAAPEITDQTAMLSGNQDLSVCELYGLKDLVRLHDGEQPGYWNRFTLADQALNKPEYDEALGIWLIEAWTHFNPTAHYAPELSTWFASGQPMK